MNQNNVYAPLSVSFNSNPHVGFLCKSGVALFITVIKHLHFGNLHSTKNCGDKIEEVCDLSTQIFFRFLNVSFIVVLSLVQKRRTLTFRRVARKENLFQIIRSERPVNFAAASGRSAGTNSYTIEITVTPKNAY